MSVYIYDPFFTRKTHISENNSLITPFLLCSCFRTHPTNTTSQNIGGTDAWAVLPPQSFLGTVPQSPYRSPPVSRSLGRKGREEHGGDNWPSQLCWAVRVRLVKIEAG